LGAHACGQKRAGASGLTAAQSGTTAEPLDDGALTRRGARAPARGPAPPLRPSRHGRCTSLSSRFWAREQGEEKSREKRKHRGEGGYRRPWAGRRSAAVGRVWIVEERNILGFEGEPAEQAFYSNENSGWPSDPPCADRTAVDGSGLQRLLSQVLAQAGGARARAVSAARPSVCGLRAQADARSRPWANFWLRAESEVVNSNACQFILTFF
jgi:hypothetical protein